MTPIFKATPTPSVSVSGSVRAIQYWSMVTLRNGSGTVKHNHRPVLNDAVAAADANARCGYTLTVRFGTKHHCHPHIYHQIKVKSEVKSVFKLSFNTTNSLNIISRPFERCFVSFCENDTNSHTRH